MGKGSGKGRGCCGGKTAPEGFQRIAQDRKCTDIGCLLFFIVFWVTMVAVAIVGIQTGEPQKLLYASNWEGDTCGGPKFPEKKFTLYPRTTEDIVEMFQKGYTPPQLAADPSLIKFFGICKTACPKKGEWSCTKKMDDQLRLDGFTTIEARDVKLKECKGNAGGAFLALLPLPGKCSSYMAQCFYSAVDHKDLFFRCMPKYNNSAKATDICVDPIGAKATDKNCVTKMTTTVSEQEASVQPNLLFDQLNSWAITVGFMIADVQTAVLQIFVTGIGCATATGFVWLLLLRFCGGCMVWSTIWGVILACGGFTFYAYMNGGLVGNDITGQLSAAAGTDVTSANLAKDAQQQELWKYVAYFMTVVSVGILLLTVALRTKINIAVGIMKEASKGVAAMPIIVGFPVITTAMIAVLTAYFAVILAYLKSAGSISINDVTSAATSVAGDLVNVTALLGANATGTGNGTLAAVTGISSNTNLADYLAAYHFFGFLWTNAWINGIGILTLAGAFGDWYFRDPEKGLGKLPILRSWGRTWRYHLGSIAYGAFIIAVVQFMRAVLMYIQDKAPKDNKAVQIALKIISCCLWCLEKCLKFISKNAYIIIALKGKSFCSATKEVFGILFKNAAQIAVSSMISGLMILLGKIIIIAVCGFVGFTWLGLLSDQLNSMALPMVLILLMSFFVATTFLNVYSMAIDTILICFCIDKEVNDGSEAKPFRMGDSLRKYVDSNTTKKKKDGGTEI
jgi:choline transporter-like protein 2/4/5